MAGGNFGGGDGSAGSPFLVEDAADLDAVRNNTSAHYRQTADIDMQAYLDSGYPGEGWEPVSSFSGSYDGNGFVIRNLWISRGSTNLAMFGYCDSTADGAGLRKVVLQDVEITADSLNVAALVGFMERFDLEDCEVTGTISGNGGYVGGLIGWAQAFGGVTNQIARCRFEGTIATDSYVGGMAGYAEATRFEDCRVLGTLGHAQADGAVGGIAGDTEDVQFVRCFANVTLIGNIMMGGICGDTSGAGERLQAEECVALGEILGGEDAIMGGFLGMVFTGGATITDSYAIMNLKRQQGAAAPDYEGGFLGRIFAGSNQGDVTIERCYSAGEVGASAEVSGGFVGEDDGDSGRTITYDCNFYDSTVAGLSDTLGAAPKSTVEMRTAETFSGCLDLINVWWMDGYPSLRWQASEPDPGPGGETVVTEDQVREIADDYLGTTVAEEDLLHYVNAALNELGDMALLMATTQLAYTDTGVWQDLPAGLTKIEDVRDSDGNRYRNFVVRNGKIQFGDTGTYSIAYRYIAPHLDDFDSDIPIHRAYLTALASYAIAQQKLRDDDNSPDGLRHVEKFKQDADKAFRTLQQRDMGVALLNGLPQMSVEAIALDAEVAVGTILDAHFLVSGLNQALNEIGDRALETATVDLAADEDGDWVQLPATLTRVLEVRDSEGALYQDYQIRSRLIRFDDAGTYSVLHRRIAASVSAMDDEIPIHEAFRSALVNYLIGQYYLRPEVRLALRNEEPLEALLAKGQEYLTRFHREVRDVWAQLRGAQRGPRTVRVIR